MEILIKFGSIIGLLFVFLIILYAAYFVSKLIAGMQYGRFSKLNIKIIESVVISPGKMLQIVEVSGNYILLGLCKDNIIYIKDINKEDINFEEKKPNFENIFLKHINSIKEKKDEKN